jgi:hypothetical protein
VRVRPRPAAEADQVERLADPLVASGAEADVAGHREVREQCALLEDHPDPPALRLDPLGRPGHHAAADRHAPRVGPLEAGDHPQQRGLPRAARAEQRHEAAVLDAQAGAVDRPQGAERLAEAASLDGREIVHAVQS